MSIHRLTGARDGLAVLVRGWKLTVGLPVAFGLLALLACSLQTPIYEATAALYVTAGTNGEGRSLPYENVLGAAGRVTSYVKLTYSDEVLARAVKAANLNMTVAQARGAIRSGVVPESEMFTVSARAEDREVAQRFATALAHSMIATIAVLEVPNGGGPPTARLTLVSPAAVNPDPVSPTTLMNVTLAGIAGLLVGMVAALTRERLNNTIRDEQDIEKIVGVRPLGSIPHDEVLAAARIIGFDAPASPAADAFRHLRTVLSVARSERSVSTILVASPRDGEGKSTVAINLATAFAESGSTVVIVDADFGNPAVATRTGNCEGPGLADAIRSQIPLLQRATTVNLKIISAGRSHDGDLADLLASSACGIFFANLAKSFDYVIVDSPSLFDGPEAEEVARRVDGVLLVARQGRSKISDCYEAAARFSGTGTNLVGVILNDVGMPGSRAQTSSPVASRPRRQRLASATPTTTPGNGLPMPRPNWPAAKTPDRNR